MRQLSDIVLVARDFNAQLGELSSSVQFHNHEPSVKRWLGLPCKQHSELSTSGLGSSGRFTLGPKRTDNVDRLLHLCSTRIIFREYKL